MENEKNNQPEQEQPSEVSEKSQAEQYYDEHKNDYESLFRWKSSKDKDDEEEKFVEDPNKSQAENYYDKHMEELENAYKIRHKKKKTEEEQAPTSNLDLQQYDQKDLPAYNRGAWEEEEKDHVSIEYDLTADEVRQGMKRFQKKMLYKRNVIYTVLFGLIGILYFVDMAFRRVSNNFTYIALIICIAVIFIIWYNPRHHREQVAKAMSQVREKFTMNVYDEYIYIKEEYGGFRVEYRNPKVFVIEQSDKFVIGIGKERIYIIPKRCLSEEQITQVHQKFQNLEERFTVEE